MTAKVTLLAYTQPADRSINDQGTEPDKEWCSLEELLAAEKRICNVDMSVNFFDIINEEIEHPELVKKRLLEAIEPKGATRYEYPEPHQGLFEHVSFTFLIEGVSRVMTHQLVRHRMAAYLQMSQRSTKMDNVDIVIPPSVPEELHDIFLDTQADSLELYNLLIKKGVPMDDARYVMSHGDETRLIMTLNGSALMHFIKLRTDTHAQWEIKLVANEMTKLVLKVLPTVFESDMNRWK